MLPAKPGQGRSRVLLEPLEPRYLLSADLTPFIVDMIGPDGDEYTLRYDQATDFLQVIDDTTGEIVDQKLLQEISEIRIVGTEQDDRLTIDLANFVVPGGITFDGGLGSDELNIINGNFDSATHNASAFGAGVFDMVNGADTQNIGYSAVETIHDSSAAAARIFANETGVGQTVRLTDDATPGDGVFTVDSAGTGGFSPVSFASPTGSVSLVAGDSGDTIAVDDSASGAAPAIDVQGGLGIDTLLGADSANAWTIDGADSGTVDDVAFSGVENLAGGSAEDTFYMGASGSVSGQISGGSGEDTLVAADTANEWEITGANAGTLNAIAFVDIENLTGGAGDDVFRVPRWQHQRHDRRRWRPG